VPKVVGSYLRESRFLYVRNPRCGRLHVGCSNCGARSAILLYSDRESASARAFSFVLGIHNASTSKSHSLASNKHLLKTCMDAPRIVRLAIPWDTALLSTCITSVFPFHFEAQCSRTCLKARIYCVLICSLPLAMERGIGIENPELGAGCFWLWLR